MTYCGLLSGGSVISSFLEKDQVCLGYAKNDYVIGGKMEENAFFQSAKASGIPCIIIEGICDWGVAKKEIKIQNKQKKHVKKMMSKKLQVNRSIHNMSTGSNRCPQFDIFTS